MMTNEIIFFELKGSGDFIRIELINFSHQNAELDWDNNWIKSKVTLKAGGFSGQFECDLITTDFDKFKTEFIKLYTKLNGSATFDSLEEQLKIHIKGDGLGHFEAKCMVRDVAGIGNKLEFEIHFDQTFIPEIIQQLDTIRKVYPVKDIRK